MTTLPFEPRRFRSTAAFYSRYRIPYPAALILAVAQRIGLEPGDGVLDLGCGPGPLAIAFAQLGMRVTGLDPEPEMLATAKSNAAEAGLDIDFRQGSSYDLGPGFGRFKLVTMGRSFHWMDRAATLTALDGLIEPGGAIGLFHDRRISSSPDWRDLMEGIAEKFSPERSQNRHFRRSPDWAPHEEVLLQSRFSAVETIGRVLARDVTIDDLVGRAYSMSVTSPETLGDRREAFEEALRTALAAASPYGRFTEIVGVDAILAFRADATADTSVTKAAT